MNTPQLKSKKLTQLGFKRGEHFRIRKGKVEWCLSAMRPDEAIIFHKYLNKQFTNFITAVI